MPDVVHMIEFLGGTRAAARRLNLLPSTVQYWKRHNRVPPWRRETLEAAYRAARAEQDQRAAAE